MNSYFIVLILIVVQRAVVIYSQVNALIGIFLDEFTNNEREIPILHEALPVHKGPEANHDGNRSENATKQKV